MKTLSILSIHSTKDLLGTCLPKSLKAWLNDNNIKFKKPKKDCLVNIIEVKKKRSVLFFFFKIKTYLSVRYNGINLHGKFH